MNLIKRGDIYLADLSPVIGSEQGGNRPVLVIQNDIGNHFSPTIIVVAITSNLDKPHIKTHYHLLKKESGLKYDSIALCEQIRTIDKSRLKVYYGTLDKNIMKELDDKLALSIGLDNE